MTLTAETLGILLALAGAAVTAFATYRLIGLRRQRSYTRKRREAALEASRRHTLERYRHLDRTGRE